MFVASMYPASRIVVNYVTLLTFLLKIMILTVIVLFRCAPS